MSPRPDPIPELKRQLASEIVRALDGWSLGEIAVFFGVDQPRLSNLRRGKLERFSVDGLIRVLAPPRTRRRVELRVVKEPLNFNRDGGGRARPRR